MTEHRIVFAVYNADSGGAVMSVTRRQAEYLTSKGYRVTLISNRCPASWKGVETRTVPALSAWFWRAMDRLLVKTSSWMPAVLRERLDMRRVLPQRRLSVEVARELSKSASIDKISLCICCQHFMAYGLKRFRDLYGTPFLLISHGDIFSHPGNAFSLPLSWLYKHSATFAYRTADHVIVVAKSLGIRAEQCGAEGEKVSVIANGVDIAQSAGEQPERSMEREKVLNLLFVGRLAPEKGIHILLDAIGSIPEHQLTLKIVGYGVSEPAIRERIAEKDLCGRVQLVGAVHHENLGSYYQSADVLVLPSITEGLPLVILEAQANGLPVLATAVGGIPDVIESGLNGILVAPNDAGAIANAIRMILADQSQLLGMSMAARERAQEYAWPTVLESFEKLIQKMLKVNEVSLI